MEPPNLKPIFYPSSLVVIGVSEKPTNLARNILANLRAFGYRGDLYAVGRQRGRVYDVDIVPSLDELPDGIDLGVILTPAELVPDLVEGCGRKGIRHLVIESGGFAEFSAAGRRLEKQVVETARRWGIRFVGPNCISVINLEIGLCLPFPTVSPATLRLGPASVIAQSGGVSITYLDRLPAAGVGVNKVISIGNKADLDEVDYLRYLLADEGTGMVLLYLESVDDGRQLMELARAADKPVIIHKANRGQASQRIAFSHTAALADDDRIVSAAFRQAGILRAEDFRDAAAVAQGMALPPVQGDELVIISRSGGHAVIAADAAERYGFRLPPIPDDLARAVRASFRADVIDLANPIDLGTVFDFDLYARIVESCLQALQPDAVLLINAYSLAEAEGAHRLGRRVQEIVRATGRPVAFCAYAQGEAARAIQREIELPVFADIEDALRGLAASRDYARWRAARGASLPHPVGEPSAAVAHLLEEAGPLPLDRALALCQACGIHTAPWQVAADADGAVQAAERLGYPVVLKTLAAGHKSDLGGVVLGLSDAATLRREATAMLERLPGSGLLVQRMAAGGVEVILGGKRDPSFGPVVMFGLGGVYVELFDDVAFRVAPLSRADAEAMIAEVRASRLLAGARGQPPVDRAALVDALLALSRLLAENPRLAEIDINPLIVSSAGVVAVDARAAVR